MKKFSYSVIVLLIFLLNVSFSYADIPKIILNQKRAIVTIYVNDKHGKQIGTGTGFVIDSDGIIATNYHVISMYLEDDNKLLIKMENGAYFPLSEVVNYDEENDVAIFKVDGKELPKIIIAKNYKPKQGENIAVIGSPLGLETTVSNGIISSIRGKGEIIQITAPISPGSSGSPVFNSKGEVIGVATFLFKDGQSLNFAIHAKYVANLSKGTKKIKKKEIVHSAIPAETNSPPNNKTMAAFDWAMKAAALFVGGKYSDPEKAIEYLTNAIKLEPDNADAYNNRGVAHEALGQHQLAIADFNEAIRVKPDLDEAYSNRGVLYANLGQHQLAIADYNEAIRLKPDNGEAYNNRGVSCKNLGQYQLAIVNYNEAIRLEPYNAKRYSNRASAYFLQGNNRFGCTDAYKACELGICQALEWAKGKGYCH